MTDEMKKLIAYIARDRYLHGTMNELMQYSDSIPTTEKITVPLCGEEAADQLMSFYDLADMASNFLMASVDRGIIFKMRYTAVLDSSEQTELNSLSFDKMCGSAGSICLSWHNSLDYIKPYLIKQYCIVDGGINRIGILKNGCTVYIPYIEDNSDDILIFDNSICGHYNLANPRIILDDNCPEYRKFLLAADFGFDIVTPPRKIMIKNKRT